MYILYENLTIWIRVEKWMNEWMKKQTIEQTNEQVFVSDIHTHMVYDEYMRLTYMLRNLNLP